MKKGIGSALLAGALLATGGNMGAQEAKDVEKIEGAGLALEHSLLMDWPDGEKAIRPWQTGGTPSESVELAQNVAAPGPAVSLRATGGGAGVGVTHEFSTWSDMTALFRPSRWGNPFMEGGALSWMNYKAWGSAPGRTAKVLLGEAIVAGAGYAIYEAAQDDNDNNSGENTDTATSLPGGSATSGTTGSSSSSGDTSLSSSSSSGDTSSSSSSSSGGTSTSSSSSSSSSGELPF